MDKLKKILKWLVLVLPCALGIIEAAIKALKEILTTIVDVLFPVIPIEKFKKFITWLRAKIDWLYDKVSIAKAAILKWIGMIPNV